VRVQVDLVSQLIQYHMGGWLRIMNWEQHGGKQSCPMLMFYSSTCLERLKKTIKYLQSGQLASRLRISLRSANHSTMTYGTRVICKQHSCDMHA
jgi:hypothetical protein